MRLRELRSTDRARLTEICRRFHVRRLSVFGSVLKGKDRRSSDLDLLVEFEPDRIPGFEFFHLQDELTKLFGQTVDLHTRGSLSRYFRDEVERSAESLYVA